jgi:hypothetical protein
MNSDMATCEWQPKLNIQARKRNAGGRRSWLLEAGSNNNLPNCHATPSTHYAKDL